MAQTFTAGSFIGRWFFSLVLVLGTYNPTEYSYVSWVLAKGTHFGPVVALVGLVLLIGCTFCYLLQAEERLFFTLWDEFLRVDVLYV